MTCFCSAKGSHSLHFQSKQRLSIDFYSSFYKVVWKWLQICYVALSEMRHPPQPCRANWVCSELMCKSAPNRITWFVCLPERCFGTIVWSHCMCATGCWVGSSASIIHSFKQVCDCVLNLDFFFLEMLFLNVWFCVVIKEEVVFEQIIGSYKINMYMTCIIACLFFFFFSLTVCLMFDIFINLIYPITKYPSTRSVRSSLVTLYAL